MDRSPGHGPEGDCHVWTAATNPRNGYGQIRVGRQTVGAHRVAWFLRTGSWPKAHVLHHCDNPPCVRFEHLFQGSHLDNVADRHRKGRSRSAHGEQAGPAKLTEQEVREIRASPLSGRDIAAQYGISQSEVSKIKRRLYWTHVQ